MNKAHRLNFYTAYHQFYLCDSDSLMESASKGFWNEKAFEHKLAYNKDFIAISTKSYGHIKGVIEVIQKESSITNFDLYDHIVEVGIEIMSGILQVLDCPNNKIEKEISLIPGKYRVRIYYQNLTIFEGEDEEEGNDFYKIQIWNDEFQEMKILKKFSRLF